MLGIIEDVRNKFETNKVNVKNNGLTELQNNIISLISDSPIITQETLSRLLNVNIRTVQRNLKILINMGKIERVGATKKGEWLIKN